MKKYLKSISIAIVILFIFNLIPLRIHSNENITNAQTISHQESTSINNGSNYIVKELVEKRNDNTRIYLNSNGSETAVVFNAKVNYNTTNGYNKISNKLVDVDKNIQGDYKYKNDANSFNLYLKDDIRDEKPLNLKIKIIT